MSPTVSFRLDQSLHERLATHATDTGQTKTEIMDTALRAHLKVAKPTPVVEKLLAEQKEKK